MMILGLPTSTAQVGCAIGGHEGILGSIQSTRGRRHAETLTPAIEFLCRQSRVELADIGAIAVDLGPGMFTGLRVGQGDKGRRIDRGNRGTHSPDRPASFTGWVNTL